MNTNDPKQVKSLTAIGQWLWLLDKWMIFKMGQLVNLGSMSIWKLVDIFLPAKFGQLLHDTVVVEQ